MSQHNSYYICYLKDGKLYPYGPYTNDGTLQPTLDKIQSYSSDLYQYFKRIPKEMRSEEFDKEFGAEDERFITLGYLPYRELPDEPLIRRGYFLIDDVKKYEKYGDDEELFYEYLSPEMYIAKSDNELKFGMPPPKKDCEGNEFEQYSAAEYMNYAYIDSKSVGAEVAAIKYMVRTLNRYDDVFENDIVIIYRTSV